MNKRSPISSIFTLLISGAALTIVAIGCGSSDGDANGPGGSGDVYTLDNVCEKMAAHQCAAVKSCCESSQIGYDEAGCLAQARVHCDEEVAKTEDDKRLFQPEAVDGCLAVLEGMYRSCELTMEELLHVGRTGPVCARVFAGLVEEGGACVEDSDCKPPADETEYAACRDGQCSLRRLSVEEGEECDSRSLCAPGLHCAASSDPFAEPGVGKCKRPKQLGESCTPSLFGNPCAEKDTCDWTSETCVPGKAVGASCDTMFACESNRCIEGRCAEAETFEIADAKICKGEADDSDT